MGTAWSIAFQLGSEVCNEMLGMRCRMAAFPWTKGVAHMLKHCK